MNIKEMARNPKSIRTRKLLQNFREIESALAMGWTWREIAKAIDIDVRGLRDAYVRLKKRINSGRIELPDSNHMHQDTKQNMKDRLHSKPLRKKINGSDKDDSKSFQQFKGLPSVDILD